MLPPRCPRAERPCDFFSEHSQHERSMRDARCGGQTRALSRARRAIWLGGYEDYNNVSVCKATSGAPRNYPTAPQRNIRFHHVLITSFRPYCNTFSRTNLFFGDFVFCYPSPSIIPLCSPILCIISN